MIRKYADFRNISCLIDKQFSLTYMDNNDFKGYVSLIQIHKVTDPIVVKVAEQDICVADNNYCWTRHFPDEGNYSLITMYDADQEVIQWYFDICTGNKVDAQGMPFFDDIYLDISVMGNGEIYLLDEDELEDALTNNIITIKQYQQARADALELLAKIRNDEIRLLNKTKEHLNHLLTLR